MEVAVRNGGMDIAYLARRPSWARVMQLGWCPLSCLFSEVSELPAYRENCVDIFAYVVPDWEW